MFFFQGESLHLHQIAGDMFCKKNCDDTVDGSEILHHLGGMYKTRRK